MRGALRGQGTGAGGRALRSSRPRSSVPRPRVLFATLALLLAACSSKAPQRAAAFEPMAVGTPVPTYTIRTLAGDTVRFGGAEPVTIVNVWATWCTSCREEMAALDSLRREFGARGLRVVGVSVDEGSEERVRRFAESNHLGFAVAHDPAGDIERAYQVVGVPTSFLVGRDGKLRWQRTGNIEEVLPALRAEVSRALSE